MGISDVGPAGRNQSDFGTGLPRHCNEMTAIVTEPGVIEPQPHVCPDDDYTGECDDAPRQGVASRSWNPTGMQVIFTSKKPNDLFALRFSWRLLGFWCWLAREVLRSSLEVARVVLDPRLPISPRAVEIESTSPHPFDQVLLGNSITLTPGTLTLDLHKGMLRVHTLTEAGASDLMSGEMDRRVAGLNKG